MALDECRLWLATINVNLLKAEREGIKLPGTENASQEWAYIV